jgi:hypothetical protein
MIVSCTKKLQDQLKISPTKVESTDPLFSWHANILNVNRRKTLVLVNDASRYAVVLHGLKSKDFLNIRTTISKALKEALLSESIKPDVIDNFLAEGGDIVFSKSQSRTLLARMNQGCEAAVVFDDEYNIQTIFQPAVSKKANAWVFVDLKNRAAHPNELFYEALESKYGKPIFNVKTIILKIRLNLTHFDVWRKVSVPLNTNFETLHRIIRICFGWGYYHLHSFTIFDKQKIIARIYGDDNAFEELPFDEPILSEEAVLISEFLPKHKQIMYTYDFGDNWEHIIEVENVLFGSDKNFPVCLEAHGYRPPEDIGGEGGYIEFLKMIRKPKNADSKLLKVWYEVECRKGLDIDLINRHLQYMR